MYRECIKQIDGGKALQVPGLGVVGYQPLRESRKVVYLKLDQQFLDVHQLEYAQNMAEFEAQTTVVLGPPIRASFNAMAKTANIEKGAFAATMGNIFTIIGELMSELPSVEIDLNEFGKFQAMNKQVMYAPLNKNKPPGLQGKQTVKALMDYGTHG